MLEIDCGEKGCPTKGDMTSQEQRAEGNGPLANRTVVKSAAPVGWAYVRVHRFVARAYCPMHKEAARVQMQEVLANLAVKPPVKRAYKRAR